MFGPPLAFSHWWVVLALSSFIIIHKTVSSVKRKKVALKIKWFNLIFFSWSFKKKIIKKLSIIIIQLHFVLLFSLFQVRGNIQECFDPLVTVNALMIKLHVLFLQIKHKKQEMWQIEADERGSQFPLSVSLDEKYHPLSWSNYLILNLLEQTSSYIYLSGLSQDWWCWTCILVGRMKSISFFLRGQQRGETLINDSNWVWRKSKLIPKYS